MAASINLQMFHQDGLQSSTAMQLQTQQRQVSPVEASASLESHQDNDGSSQQRKLAFRSHRVGRACDECRSRKIKCDGRHPCLHCTFLNYDCSYDRPSKRAKRRSQKEIEELESKLQQAQNILKSISPDLDIDSPNLDVDALKKISAQTKSEASHFIPLDSRHTGTQQTAPLETVLEVTGKLDLDEQGNWSYHGHGSSSAFISRIGERFGNVSDTGPGLNTVLRLRSVPPINEAPKNPEDQSFESAERSMMLPPKDVALDLISSALDEACALLKFVHEPSFYSMFYRLYRVDPELYGYEENKFLPLLYAALAVGYLFSSSERAHFGNAHAVSQGEKFFVASRRMLDITECRDIWSLQAVLFMIIFLQSSARMTSCHSYVSAAMAASLQMGLHRCEPEAFDPIEREIRKRIFWTIRTMETYVIAILGLPRTVSDDDIDQEMPLEIDDQYITKEGVLSMPDRQISEIASLNAHSKLGQILAKVISNVYPTKRMHRDATEKPRAYVVSDVMVREVEVDLQYWAKNLPMQLRLGGDSPQKLLRVQHLLRLAYTHVQLVLYRPFLHYISCARTESPESGQCYAYAAACVDVGRNVIHNIRQMEKQNTVAGPYWFSIYTTFCATLALVFYVWENSDVEGALQTLKDAEYGRDVLVKLGHKSIAAARHSEVLATIFDRLPERLGKTQRNQSNTKRNRHTRISNKDDGRSYYGNTDIENIETTYSSADSRASTQRIEAVDSSSPLEIQLHPLPFPTIPERQSHNNFARFLGPDSIEDLFRTQSEHSGGIFPFNTGSGDISHYQHFDSLDQYVSTLDMQTGQERFPDTSDLAKDGSPPINKSPGTTKIDTGRVGPFIPFSPYLMQMYLPTDNHLSSGPAGFLTEDYSVVDPNNHLQESRLQGTMDNRGKFWTKSLER